MSKFLFLLASTAILAMVNSAVAQYVPLKERLGGISKQDNRYLRWLLITGATLSDMRGSMAQAALAGA
jgi:hypothetical protein